MKRAILIPALVALLLAFGVAIQPSSAKASGFVEDMNIESEAQQPCNHLQQYDGDPLDLQGCQQYCGSIFGVEPYWNPGRGGNGYGVGYAVCIQKCNRRYWKAWDKEVKGEGK